MKALILKKKTQAPESFQLPVNYKTNNLLINFRVSRIIQMIDEFGISIDSAVSVDVNEFTGKYYKWIVLDGNRRITHALEEKSKDIKVFCLDTNSLVENNKFSTEFDKYLYNFQNEVVALATYIRRDNYSDEDVFKLSYFCSGKVCNGILNL